MRQFLLLAFRNVFRNRRRTIMTMLIVTVGVSALILSGGFFAYMFHELAEGTIRFGIGHLQICSAAALTRSETRVMEHGLQDYQEILSTARRIAHVPGTSYGRGWTGCGRGRRIAKAKKLKIGRLESGAAGVSGSVFGEQVGRKRCA